MITEINEKNEKITKEFNDLVCDLPTEKFWYWVSKWDDIDSILGIINNWDIAAKEEAIKEMRKIKWMDKNKMRW